MKIQVAFNNGVLVVQVGSKFVSLDPRRESNSDFTFISHAHTDHLTAGKKKINPSKKILASQATTIIANSRGRNLGHPIEIPEGYDLLDSGHILGSRGFLIPDELFYTGDISIRDRAFLKGARLPKSKKLILETTFARPEYVFPPLEQCIHETHEMISKMYSRGVPIILMGHPLGKAQLLTEFFGHWDPLIIHDSVDKMNSVYRRLGIPLKEGITYSQARERGLIRRGVPWIMISPLMSRSSEFIRSMRKCCNAVTVGFTGWAVRARFKHVLGLDYAIPISDHCDFNELFEVVRSCNPQEVYTIHGFADYFAMRLRNLGYDATAIKGQNNQNGIDQRKFSKNESLDTYFD